MVWLSTLYCVIVAQLHQATDEEFPMSVVPDGREGDFQLRTRVDRVLPNSIITKEKADLTQGMSVEIPAALEFKDSKGILYSTQHSIILRCVSGGSPKSFYETFHIVDRCELDALLRYNISEKKLKNEPKALPLQHRRKTEGTRSAWSWLPRWKNWRWLLGYSSRSGKNTSRSGVKGRTAQQGAQGQGQNEWLEKSATPEGE
jgi:hypothetical protein